MRQVFTSPRLENVEAVAALLRGAGIEVKITQARSYRGNRRSSFSYRAGEDAAPQPAVWIVHAEDQPRGRQLLREAGLIDSSRAGESSYLPLSLLERDKDAATDAKAARAMRIKLALLAAIVVVIGLMVFGVRRQAAAPHAAASASATATATAKTRAAAPPLVPETVDDVQTYRADVPTALAKLLIETALATDPPARACISIDEKDPAPGFIQALEHAPATGLLAASACPGDAADDIGVHDYMTDGSGRGSVQVTLGRGDTQIVEVERLGSRWRVLRVR
jgi:hypothetical protein